MLHHRALTAATALAGGLLLAGCAGLGSTASVPTSFPSPQKGDGGVVIAESQMVKGTTSAVSAGGNVDDCAGPGLGVTVQSSVMGGHYLFDKNGEPCESAQTLFDGGSEAGRRAADPSIALTVYDSFGPVPPSAGSPRAKPRNAAEAARFSGQTQSLPAIPRVRVTSDLLPPMSAAIEPAAGPAGMSSPLATPEAPRRNMPQPPDTLVATLTSWERQDNTLSSRAQEANAAAERDLANISSKNRGDPDTTAQLMAKLRERERQIEEEQRRNSETLARSQQNRARTLAAQQAWQQHEAELQTELETTRKRMAQFQDLSQRLAAEKSAKEQAYQSKISTLSADLKAAEVQADTSRRELILQAAAKIAEAEQLARAAQLQEEDSKLREAARLKAEAETMMDRALAIKAGQGVVVQGVGAPQAAPMALMSTPVVVHANGQSLPDILTAVLTQAAPQAGQWKADWQLSAPVQKILKEKWSLTAEAPLEQVLAQLAQQVRAMHGAALTFTQFPQSRLLVVTDTPVVK